jgi:hypothetical protein
MIWTAWQQERLAWESLATPGKISSLSMDDSSGDLILYQKEKGVKFYEVPIVISKTMHRQKIFGDIRNM